MSNTLWLDAWLIRTAFAGGAILLLGLIWMLFTRQPARRQRIGELSLCSGLLVALLAALPGWWSCPTEWTAQVAPLQENHSSSAKPQVALVKPQPTMELDSEEFFSLWEDLLDDAEPSWFTGFYWMLLNPAEAEARLASNHTPELLPPPETCTEHEKEEAPTPAASTLPPLEPIPWTLLLGGTYFLIMGYLLCRCLAGYIGLWRLVHSAEKAPAHALALLEKLTPDWKRKPHLAVHPRLHGPISFGLWRPTILMPPKFCYAGDQAALRALLVHELTHLERRDAWSCLLLAVSQAVYFYLPWFWWLRRQIHLAQEYIADAAAACLSSAVDYAQYLVSWSTWTSRPTLAGSRANGVFQRTSELYRRVDMLLTNPMKVEAACSRRWTFAAAASFLAVAALAAGVRVQAQEPPQKKSVTVVAEDKDCDCKCEKKTEIRQVTLHGTKTDTTEEKHQKIQIVIVGQDGETKLAEVPGNVGTLMLQPRKEDGKPHRVEVILVDEKGQQIKGGHVHTQGYVLDKTSGQVLKGPVKAMATWQGKDDAPKHVGPNVIRIIAVTEDGEKTTPRVVKVIGQGELPEGKHDVRVNVKPVIGTPLKADKVDVIVVDESGSLYKKQVSGEKLQYVKPGDGTPHTIYLRAVEDKDGAKGQIRLQEVKPGATYRYWSEEKDGKPRAITPGVKVWSEDGKATFTPMTPRTVTSTYPQLMTQPGKPLTMVMPSMPSTPLLPQLPSTYSLKAGDNLYYTPHTLSSGTTYLYQGQENMREQQERIEKALQELQKALDSAGDRIPGEARKQLMEAKRQLEEARGKLRTRVRGRLDDEREKMKGTEEKKESSRYQLEVDKEKLKAREALEKAKRKDMDDEGRKKKAAEDDDRKVERMKRQADEMRQRAEAERRAAEAERRRAEEMLRVARAREEQARRMAEQQEEQARRAQADAERALGEARKRAEMESRRAQDNERNERDARRKAEAERAERDARRQAEMKRQKDQTDDNTRRAKEEAERKQELAQRAQQLAERRAALEALRKRQQEKDAQGDKETPKPRQAARQLGVQLEPVSPDVIALLDLPEGRYVLLRSVVPGSAAERAGFKNNDILLTFAGKRIQEPEDLVKMVQDPSVDGHLEAVVFRKGKKVVIRNIEMAAPRKYDSESPRKAEPPATPKPPTTVRPPASTSRAPVPPRAPKSEGSSSNKFTIISQEDGVTITIKGQMADGRMSPESITIKDSDNEDTYDSLRRVPSRYRAKVAKLLEQGGKTAK
jgi:beta-lactamase regulating signal transducer with metallopeptidase domain